MTESRFFTSTAKICFAAQVARRANASSSLSDLPRADGHHRPWFALLLVFLVFSTPWQTMAGTWTPVTRTAPGAVGLMLLLSDGTVMVENNNNSSIWGPAWYRLTPSSTGSYVNGTWTSLASMHETRLFFASQVLKDGRVFVAGGEYGTGKTTAETYNPLTNTWTSAPNAGATFSDANSEILPDGRVMIALVEGSLEDTKIFNPVTNTWASGPAAKGVHNESAWVKLPDGSILMVDRDTTNSERYIPSQNQWISDANVPVSLYDPYGSEMGGAFLLPNGKTFFLGGTGQTAIYTPSGTTANGSWVAGANFPNAQGAPDAPGAMMPNGKILCAVCPKPTSADHFPSPTSFYEYDYVTNTYAQVNAPAGGTTESGSSFQRNMLVLPDGTVLSSRFSNQLYVYSSSGTPVASGKPTISSITQNADGSYHLTGTKLNGISQGACYGDDAQMATNYPIVRLTSGSNVYYCRTFNWSSTGVMTGSTTVTTEFSLPAGLPTGAYSLVVVANGISSDAFAFSNAATQPASITAPLTSTPLTGTTATFVWDAGVGADAYWLYVGTTSGNSELYNSNSWVTSRSQTITNLPLTGQPIYVRLWSRIGSGSPYRDYVFTAASPPVADIAVQQPAGTALTDGSGSSISFGNVNVGSVGTPLTFTIQNSGTANLTSLAIAKDGANSTDFTVSAPGLTTLAPGATTTFVVTFAPGASGARSAAIHIASNVAGSKNPFDVSLSGSGTATAVTLAQAMDTTGLIWTTGGNANWSGQTTNTHDGVDAAQSGLILDNQDTYEETTVTGPGSLTFWWKVSSELDFDYLRFALDGTEQFAISGALGWEQRTVSIPTGSHTLRWHYSKDGSVSSGSDAGWVDQVVFTSLVPSPVITSATSASGAVGQAFSYQIAASNSPTSFGASNLPPGLTVNTGTGLISGTPTSAGNTAVTLSATNLGGTGTATLNLTVSATLTLAQALDTTGLSWTTGGNSNWTAGTTGSHDGVDTARSGVVTDNQESWMETTVTGPGTLTFWWQVSSEASFDYLRFAVDGTEQFAISGTVGWEQRTLTLAAGSHILRWRYTKDVSVSAGSDAGWVDQVVFTSGTQLPIISSALSASGAVGQAFSYQITASNSPTSFGASNLPPGLTVNTGTGLISGTPTSAGNTAVTLSATNLGGTGTATLNLTVTALTLAQALDTAGPTWTTGGNANWSGQTVITHDGVDAAKSGAVTDSQESWQQTTVTGPGSLTFWWQVSSETNFDYLRFELDGVQQFAISGTVGWEQRTVSIASGSHTLLWRYSKDGSVSSGSDAGWVDQVNFTGAASSPVITSAASATGTVGQAFSYQIVATNTPTSYGASGLPSGLSLDTVSGLISGVPVYQGTYTIGISASNGSGTGSADLSLNLTTAANTLDGSLNATNLSWSTGGDGAWFGQSAVTHDGASAAQSGFLVDGQQNWVEATVTGPGTLSFWWKVSSEFFFDYVHFEVDGIEQFSNSGDVDWEQRTVTVLPGTHQIRWRYSKDDSVSAGSDCAWLDQVTFTPGSGWQSSQLTSVSNAADGNRTGVADPSSNSYYYKGTDGDVWCLFWNGATWGGVRLTSNANVDDWLTYFPGLNFLYYRGTDGHLWVVWYAGSQWNQARLTTSADVAGDLTVDSSWNYSYYRNTGNDLGVVWYAAKRWNQATITSLPGLVANVAGDISVDNATHFIYYRGVDGHLWVVWYGGGRWNQARLTGTGNVGGAVTADSGYFIYYRSAVDNTLWCVWFNGTGWSQAQLDAGSTVLANSASTISLFAPKAMFYVNSNGQLAWEYFNGTSWANELLGDGAFGLTGGLSIKRNTNWAFVRRNDGNIVIFYYR